VRQGSIDDGAVIRRGGPSKHRRRGGNRAIDGDQPGDLDKAISEGAGAASQ
jgi:hypothetical protein